MQLDTDYIIVLFGDHWTIRKKTYILKDGESVIGGIHLTLKKKKSIWSRIWDRLRGYKVGMLVFVIVYLMTLTACGCGQIPCDIGYAMAEVREVGR